MPGLGGVAVIYQPSGRARRYYAQLYRPRSPLCVTFPRRRAAPHVRRHRRQGRRRPWDPVETPAYVAARPDGVTNNAPAKATHCRHRAFAVPARPRPRRAGIGDAVDSARGCYRVLKQVPEPAPAAAPPTRVTQPRSRVTRAVAEFYSCCRLLVARLVVLQRGRRRTYTGTIGQQQRSANRLFTATADGAAACANAGVGPLVRWGEDAHVKTAIY